MGTNKFNDIKESIKNNYAIILFWCLLVIFLFYISMKLPLTADDYTYSLNRMTGVPLDSLRSVFQSVCYECQTWVGRWLCFFFAQLSYYSPNQMLFRLSFPFINCLIIYEVFVLITNRWKIEKNDISTLLTLTCLIYTVDLKVLNQTYFWIIGYYTYVFPLVLSLIPMIYLSNILRNQNQDMLFLKKHPALCAVFSFSSALFVEHYALFLFAYATVTFVWAKIKKQKLSLSFYMIWLFSFIGMGTIIYPSLMNRTVNKFIEQGLKEMLYFGYTRFIYTFYSLNQILILLMCFVMLIYCFKSKRKWFKCFSLLFVPIVFVSLNLIFDLPLFSEDTKHFLMSAWSYYHWNRIGLVKTSWIVIYTIIVFVSFFIFYSIEQKNPFSFVLISAAVLLQAIFIVTDKACERTAFITSFLLIILIVYLLLELNLKKMMGTLGKISGIILFCVMVNYCFNYRRQYQVYKNNSQKLMNCAAEENCKSVIIDEHDERFVFKSELDFSNQENWCLRFIRKCFYLEPDVEIHSSSQSY